MRKNVIASYVIVVLSKELLYSTSWELEQGKTFSKLILIDKAEDVLGEQFFCSVISESR